MITDSVFSPILAFAERPLIPASKIEKAMDKIESRRADEIISLLEDETQNYLERMDDALTDRDVRAINSSTWPVFVPLRNTIVQLWNDAFLLGSEQGIEEMQAAVKNASVEFSALRFQVPPDVQRQIEDVLNMEPEQLVNVDAVEAVIGRANLLAGDFADDLFLELRKHIVSAIVPQADTGEPISREQLIERIQSSLGVARRRAITIARTEITYAYNQGRLTSYNESPLVDYVRFLAINDLRTTAICKSRDGMLIPKSDAETLAANTPPLHYNCRSVLSPVMSRLSRFKKLIEDETRNPANRELVPLMDGWRTA